MTYHVLFNPLAGNGAGAAEAKKLKIEGVLLTMYDARTNLSAEVGQEIRKHFKEKAYKTYIPRNIKLSEAPSVGLSIYDYALTSEGAKAYVGLVKEVIAQNEKR